MEAVGTVAELWRYPVKSMQGERVERLDLAPGGAAGDRELAVVDPAAGKVLSAKRWPALLMASAASRSGSIVLTLPDGSQHDAADPAVHTSLSAWLDHEVRLEAPPAAGVFPMEMHTGMSDDTTPLFDWPGPEGTWLDLADVHWLTTASLEAIAALHPDGDWDVRRFRPTAVFAVRAEGWPEDAWTSVDVGSARSQVLMPTPRCTMPSRAQPGLDVDKAIGTTIRDRHDNNLGIYASVSQAGPVSVGDRVHAS